MRILDDRTRLKYKIQMKFKYQTIYKIFLHSGGKVTSKYQLDHFFVIVLLYSEINIKGLAKNCRYPGK